MTATPYEFVAIAGSGTIATGLAAVATTSSSRVVLLVRSEESAARALAAVEKASRRIAGAAPEKVTATLNLPEIATADLLVEAIIEDHPTKADLLKRVAEAAPGADLATTTSSLSVTDLGRDSGQPERVYGLHVFNPVPTMKLVELIFPDSLDDAVGKRAYDWCHMIQ